MQEKMRADRADRRLPARPRRACVRRDGVARGLAEAGRRGGDRGLHRPRPARRRRPRRGPPRHRRARSRHRAGRCRWRRWTTCRRVLAGDIFQRHVILGPRDAMRSGARLDGLKGRVTRSGQDVPVPADLEDQHRRSGQHRAPCRRRRGGGRRRLARRAVHHLRLAHRADVPGARRTAASISSWRRSARFRSGFPLRAGANRLGRAEHYPGGILIVVRVMMRAAMPSRGIVLTVICASAISLSSSFARLGPPKRLQATRPASQSLKSASDSWHCGPDGSLARDVHSIGKRSDPSAMHELPSRRAASAAGRRPRAQSTGLARRFRRRAPSEPHCARCHTEANFTCMNTPPIKAFPGIRAGTWRRCRWLGRENRSAISVGNSRTPN